MCGIVGYVGSQQAQNILLDGLRRLEYRGYDSAGIAVLAHNHLHIRKTKGRLQQLAQCVAAAPLNGCTGIGHTRWATHGEPSDVNAHPHTDMKKQIAVVHNGIIENHAALRAMLQQRGCVFTSQTDTEAIAHLLSTLYDGNMVTTLRKASEFLKGSYALAVASTYDTDTLFCMRKDSPLVLGIGRGEYFIASDIPALLPYTRTFDLMNDGEIAVLQKDTLTIYDSQGQVRPLQEFHVDWTVEDAEKGGYDHFMLKEIHEEPDALMKTFSAHVDLNTLCLRQEAFPVTTEEAQTLTGITIVACGTAYHAGMYGKYVIEKLTRLPVSVDIASEFRYREPVLNPNSLCLAISQSGETADTLAALREARQRGAKAMALTNVLGSTIARESAPHIMYTYAGPEIAVASTKAYITQLEVLLLFALDLAVKRNQITADEVQTYLSEMADIPSKAEAVFTSAARIQHFANTHAGCSHVFFIGRGIDHALAMEASLKLKEVSYVISEAYPAGELKHGSIALIDEGTLVCALMTQEHLADKTLANIHEVRARGARVLIICTQSLRAQAAPEADELWCIPDCAGILTPLLAIIPLQLFAYCMAVSRSCDVDKPRNLAKSVTVE